MILNQLKHRGLHHYLIAGAMASPFLLGLGVAASYSSTNEADAFQDQRTWAEKSLPDLGKVEVLTSVAGSVREFRIRPGDSLPSLISGLGIKDRETVDALRNDSNAEEIFRQIVPGKILTGKIGQDGNLVGFDFPLNGKAEEFIHVRQTSEGLAAEHVTAPPEHRVSFKAAVIRHSLFGATDAAGIPDAVAIQIAEIFGGVIDFHRDLRVNDRLAVIYESKNYRGRPDKNIRILAAELTNDGKVNHAYWHEGADSHPGYYDQTGKSLRKAFLRSPLEFSRITSGFSNARFHPVLQQIRAHQGVDYGAPTGTKVRATGDGIVEFSGNQGGYGKAVIVRHPGGKTTLYGHLSAFAPGITKGTRVLQGQTVGHVGATGVATGPHLHYEFRVNGLHQNPQTTVLPETPPLAPSELTIYQSRIRERADQLALLGSTSPAPFD